MRMSRKREKYLPEEFVLAPSKQDLVLQKKIKVTREYLRKNPYKLSCITCWYKKRFPSEGQAVLAAWKHVSRQCQAALPIVKITKGYIYDKELDIFLCVSRFSEFTSMLAKKLRPAFSKDGTKVLIKRPKKSGRTKRAGKAKATK